MTTTTLVALPPELFEIVAKDVTPKDLKSLRLVSREGNFKTLAIFSRTFFPHQVFYLNSKHSLELAVKITEHAAFAAAIKTITILIDEVHIRSTLVAEIEGARKGCLRAIETGANTSKYKTLEEGLVNHKRTLEKERAFQWSGVHTALLNQIFINLARHGDLSKIRLTDRAIAGRLPLTLPGMEYFVRRTPLGLPAQRDVRPLTLIREALEYARPYAPTRRELLVPTFSVRSSAWTLPARRMSKISQFEGFQHLEIEVSIKGCREQLTPFIKSLEHAAKSTLKTLKLNMGLLSGLSLNAKSCTAPLLDAVFDRLVTLDFIGGTLTIDEMVKFVKQQPVLQELNFMKSGILMSRSDFEVFEKEGLEALVGVRGTCQGLRWMVLD